MGATQVHARQFYPWNIVHSSINLSRKPGSGNGDDPGTVEIRGTRFFRSS